MCRLTVLYGHPTDPAEFDRYYDQIHIPIARKMRGLKGWTIGKCQSLNPNEPPPYYMIVGLYADTRANREKIIDSPEGEATVATSPASPPAEPRSSSTTNLSLSPTHFSLGQLKPNWK